MFLGWMEELSCGKLWEAIKLIIDGLTNNFLLLLQGMAEVGKGPVMRRWVTWHTKLTRTCSNAGDRTSDEAIVVFLCLCEKKVVDVVT